MKSGPATVLLLTTATAMSGCSWSVVEEFEVANRPENVTAADCSGTCISADLRHCTPTSRPRWSDMRHVETGKLMSWRMYRDAAFLNCIEPGKVTQ